MAEEMENDPECTFQPKISEKSHYLMNKSRPDFLERNQIWQNQKESRIKELGETKDSKKLLHCTFQPNIGLHNSSLNEKNNRANLQNYSGVDKFLQRQAAAREEKQRVKEALESKANSKNLGYKVTIPHGPKQKTKNIVHQKNKNEYSNKNLNDKKDIENKKQKKIEDIYYNPENIHVTNVSFRDAVHILHEQLNNFNMDFD